MQTEEHKVVISDSRQMNSSMCCHEFPGPPLDCPHPSDPALRVSTDMDPPGVRPRQADGASLPGLHVETRL